MNIQRLAKHVSRNRRFIVAAVVLLVVFAGLAIGSTIVLRELIRPDRPNTSLETAREKPVLGNTAAGNTTMTGTITSSSIGMGTTSTSGYFAAELPESVAIYGKPTDTYEPLVTLHTDGQMTFGPHYTPNKAARAFWRAVGKVAPCRPKK